MSLFKKAEPQARRLKMYIYGETGTGKTITSLHFPSPVVVDAEKGTDYYGDLFNFERLQTADPRIINKALDELLKDPGASKTLVLDPYTAVWEAMQDIQLKRMRVKNNNPHYTLQPLDYKLLKADNKGIIQKLLALDMNIIVTARAKIIYSQDPGEFMKPIGLAPDGPKDLPFLFDVVLELGIGEKGKRFARTVKDRTNTLPNEFEFTYESFVKYLGNEELEREPVVFKQETALNNFTDRSVEIKFKNKKIKTAGVTGETLTALSDAVKKIDKEELVNRLRSDFMVSSLLDLKEDEAKLLLKDIIN
jgi:hypothetical protein